MENEIESIYQYQPLWGKWQIDKLIGKGAFGKVYLVSHEEFGHTYTSAVKLISIPGEGQYQEARSSIRAADGTLRDYFLGVVQSLVNEVNILYSLSGNSNILGYHDHKIIEHQGKVGWDILIRMEYVKPLSKYLAEKQMSMGEIITLGIDICAALDICEKHGIIHRDIKDENIFINEDGIFKLGDFGIAMKMSKFGWIASMQGTPHFMAPEVYRGDPYDAAVDIYSLGIVLYRLVNHGRLPLMPAWPEIANSGSSKETLENRMKGVPFQLPDQAGCMLAKTIMKACAYRAEERYESPKAMKLDLELAMQKLSKVERKEFVTILADRSDTISPIDEALMKTQSEIRFQSDKTRVLQM